MENNAGIKLPADFKQYPGKMDHTSCVVFQVGISTSTDGGSTRNSTLKEENPPSPRSSSWKKVEPSPSADEERKKKKDQIDQQVKRKTEWLRAS